RRDTHDVTELRSGCSSGTCHGHHTGDARSTPWSAPALTCTHPHLPALTRTYLHSPALTCTHPHLPIKTECYPVARERLCDSFRLLEHAFGFGHRGGSVRTGAVVGRQSRLRRHHAAHQARLGPR